MKTSFSFVCQECGYDTPQWLGKCPECNTWNSLKEFQVSSKFKVQSSKLSGEQKELKPRRLGEIEYTEKQRVSTGFKELDGVLGGGLVAGSVVLLAGDPGIGKSTLLLQVGLLVSQAASRLSHVANDARPPLVQNQYNSSSSLSERRSLKSSKDLKEKSGSAFSSFASGQASSVFGSVLYVSGEESAEQIKLRATRLIKNSKDSTTNFLLLSVTDTDAVVEIIEKERPSLVIVDSIQTMESERVAGMSGSVGQIRYSTAAFIRVAKTLHIPIIIVGHVTKEGMVAGPMMLSHMVDVVLFFEGEKTNSTRILRGLKNRFGPVDEVGVFSMTESGIDEVKNLEQIFLSHSAGSGQAESGSAPGSVLAATLEGTRSFLVEIQGLVVFSKLPIPRRVASGIDTRRLELLLAVLQKQCKLSIGTMDVFVNVAGGLRLTDRACDLAVCLSLFSSLKNKGLDKTVAIAEVGLLGELRPVGHLEKRIKEAKSLGFKNIITHKTHKSLGEVIKTL